MFGANIVDPNTVFNQYVFIDVFMDVFKCGVKKKSKRYYSDHKESE